MSTENSLAVEQIEGTLVLTRSFDAPRDLVWKAWTDPKHLEGWWGPPGMPIKVETFELRPGGMFLYSMSTPNGGMWGRFIFREIESPERMVFVSSFSDADGNVTRAPFSQTWPLEVMNTMILTEHDGKTTLTLHGGPLNASAEELATFENNIPSMEQGFGGTFNQLDAYLATME